MIEATAHSAFETYKDALENGWLRQGTWNSEEDGRRVACALGVIDPELDSPSLCPAAVMPKWLARMVPWLFDSQKAEDAFSWGAAFYEQLDRLNGQVPFEVVYDWHANYSWQMGIEAFEKMGRDTTAQKAIQELHRRAMTGDRAPSEEWYKALNNANAYVYAYANVNAYVYADANANANAYAYVYARKAAIAQLALGLVECMKRIAA